MKYTFIILTTIFYCSVNLEAADNRSLTYAEVIARYKELDSIYKTAKLIPYGKTDCGEPLHLFVISSEETSPEQLRLQNKCLLFINNGIHAGEPDGIDASVELAKEILSKPEYKPMLEKIVIGIIPVFNIDGALERGCCSRANQNGPEEYGFRANSKNLDLNRDFIKAEARNTISLINILRRWNPDVIIDTHVSNGADYPYTMTMISAQHNKLNPVIGKYMKEEFTPALFNKMKSKGDEMIPYVQTKNGIQVPDSGIVAFMETPRYMSGYLSLFNAFSFLAESHMLKPFAQRKKSTYNLLMSLAEFCTEKNEKIIELRKNAAEADLNLKVYPFNYTCDYSKFDTINFNGYEASMKKSNVTGGMRLFYDRKKSYRKKINFYDYYRATDSLTIPKYFHLPQAYENINRLLNMNGFELTRVNEDSTANADIFYITGYETMKEPYEGHYLHYNVKTRTEKQKIQIRKGDYLVPTQQKNIRYVLETLIPGGFDSFFCWGFFDSFLQQKDGFSSYVFEDLAEELLKSDQTLKTNFETWKKENPDASDYSQLNYIYSHSKYGEKNFMRYPVGMIY